MVRLSPHCRGLRCTPPVHWAVPVHVSGENAGAGTERPKLVYICAPLRGDVANNVEFARQKAQEVFAEGNIPICPHLLFPPVADSADPAQDEKARAMGLRLLESCQQMNVYGPVWTDGMWQEIYKAGELGIPVLTDQKTIGRTPPARHPKRKER